VPQRTQKTHQPVDTGQRVSVMVGDRSVPLLPGRPLTHSAQSPWTGIILEKHRVGAVEIPEHEHHTFCLHLQTSGPVEMDWHSQGRTGRLNTGAGNLIFLTPGRNLEVIASATGFADASHLSKAFRRQVGTSPKAWQRQSKRG
jgi:AraC-like DNA-binding protein